MPQVSDPMYPMLRYHRGHRMVEITYNGAINAPMTYRIACNCGTEVHAFTAVGVETLWWEHLGIRDPKSWEIA